MAWVRFSAPFDFHPKYGVLIVYRPGPRNVPRAAAAAAIAAGKAAAIRRPATRAQARALLVAKG